MSSEIVCDTRDSYEDRDDLGNSIIEDNQGEAKSIQVDGDRVCVLFDK